MYLDTDYIGAVRVWHIDVGFNFGGLTDLDAQRGLGPTATLKELSVVLIKAGYRYRPLSTYTGNIVKFMWL